MSIETPVHNLLHSSGVLCAQIGGNLGYHKCPTCTPKKLDICTKKQYNYTILKISWKISCIKLEVTQILHLPWYLFSTKNPFLVSFKTWDKTPSKNQIEWISLSGKKKRKLRHIRPCYLTSARHCDV